MWIGTELLLTSGATEQVSFSFIVKPMKRTGFDCHPADQISVDYERMVSWNLRFKHVVSAQSISSFTIVRVDSYTRE